MQETQVQSLGWEDPLEDAMVTHSSISCWENPIDRGVRGAAVHGVTTDEHLNNNDTLP